MTKKTKPQTLKGFRDFLPAEMRVRNYVLDVFTDVFELFGFEPLQTPSLEYAQTLLGKYGENADRLVYKFTDRGGRELAMPYDLTVPTAKVLALYRNDIKLPFKRYQIQRVWRADKPQKGRYREILQCDVDIFGITSPIADAEIVAIIYNILKKLNFEEFSIRINSRNMLNAILEEAGVTENSKASLLQTLDKWSKVKLSGIYEEGNKKGFPRKMMDSVVTTIEELRKITNIETYEKDGVLPASFLKSFTAPLGELKEFFKIAKIKFGVDEKNIVFDPTLVRGLDYYTGIIFETYVTKPDIGSITGGGRYDNLIEQVGGPDTPATGTTIGLDRICDVITELGLLKQDIKSTIQVLVAFAKSEDQSKALGIATTLRSKSIATEVYLNPKADLKRQLSYANKKQIPFVAIVGLEEDGKNKVTVKNMETGDQETVSVEKIAELTA